MQFDPNILKMLLAQSDEGLWQSIRKIAAMSRIDLPPKAPNAEDMKKLREMLSGIGDNDPSEAQAIIDEYRRKGGTQ